MEKIRAFIADIKEETYGALAYAENYLNNKIIKPEFAKMYNEMAHQEINHARYLTTIGQAHIDSLSFVPEKDKTAWEKCRARTEEHIALAKLMLQN